jgi:hypothetical protein
VPAKNVVETPQRVVNSDNVGKCLVKEVHVHSERRDCAGTTPGAGSHCSGVGSKRTSPVFDWPASRSAFHNTV